MRMIGSTYCVIFLNNKITFVKGVALAGLSWGYRLGGLPTIPKAPTAPAATVLGSGVRCADVKVGQWMPSRRVHKVVYRARV